MESLNLSQYNLVYNAFSFTIATMGAATLYFWLGRSNVSKEYKNAVTITGLVTAIALYHYVRIAGSWEAAFTVANGTITASGLGFNDAYRYVDWLLTVPLLLVELVLVMNLTKAETRSKGFRLGILAALMIVLGYPGEVSPEAGVRWTWWVLAMIPFLWIVYELFVGLKESIQSQPAEVRGLINAARWLVVLSWSFYPVVYIAPMLGMNGASAAITVQVGYTIADIVAKAVFGLVIYNIAVNKSELKLAAAH